MADPSHPAGRIAPFQAVPLEFVEGRGRDYWWGLIGDAVKDWIAAETGPAIEWWAFRNSTETERPYAVVLGPRGLAVATPAVDRSGRQTQQVNVRRFVPGSLEQAIVRQQATTRGAGGPLGAAAGRITVQLTRGLSARVRGFLGNLPAGAQHRLQVPFGGDEIEAADFFYYGTEQDLDVWCYLAGRHAVTFVSGHRRGRDEWELVCRQARRTTGQRALRRG